MSTTSKTTASKKTKPVKKSTKSAKTEVAELAKPEDLTNKITLNINQMAAACDESGTNWYSFHYLFRKGKATLDLNQLPVPLLRALVTSQQVGQDIKNTITTYLTKTPDDIFKTLCSSVYEFYHAVRFISAGASADNSPVVEMELNGRWYPVILQTQLVESFFGAYVRLTITYTVCDFTTSNREVVIGSEFIDAGGVNIKKTVAELLASFKIRPTTVAQIALTNTRARKAEELGQKVGKVMDCTSSILEVVEMMWYKFLAPTRLGSEDAPCSVILEKTLELAEDPYRNEREADRNTVVLPFVRVFSTDLKRYVYVDVDDLKEHVFDRGAKDMVVLEPATRRVLDGVFNAQPQEVFGDLFRNRHGGIIILAHGGPGVGKTLTAEVYSEYTNRPLYVLEMGELGTSLDSVEKNLQVIFNRAKRWNAVLLFDEADIFLTKRGDNLEQSAIVGVFLRLLDRYEGVFFLTTNRTDVIDEAFKSRCTLSIEYPSLTDDMRIKVWQQLFNKAGINYTGDWKVLANHQLNGRNIRNTVRVLRLLFPNATETTVAHIDEALKYVAR